MRLPLLALLAISAQACLWDANDERLFCRFDEIQPRWAIRCNPPTPEPMRAKDTGTVYCGKGNATSMDKPAKESLSDDKPDDFGVEMLCWWSTSPGWSKLRGSTMPNCGAGMKSRRADKCLVLYAKPSDLIVKEKSRLELIGFFPPYPVLLSDPTEAEQQ